MASPRRQVSEGQIIKEGDAVAEMVIEDPLPPLDPGPRAVPGRGPRRTDRPALPTRSHPEMTFEGRVSRISPSVDPSNRTFQVETLVPNERGLLRPGGLASASIVTDSQAKAAVVPFESIVRFAGVTKLFIVEDGKAQPSTTSRPARKAAAGSRSSAGSSRRPPTSSPPANPSSPTARRSSSASRSAVASSLRL